MKRIISSLFFILVFAILANTASAGITVTDAEATYETNLSSADVPTEPTPIKIIFNCGNTEATSERGLSSVSIPTEPTPIKEMFNHLEEATFNKNLCTVSIPTEPAPIKEMFIHLEEAKVHEDLIFPKGLINDITPPIITNVTITNTTVNSATIKWNTDEVADSLVKYGKVSVSYTENKGDPLFVTNHTILLTGLQSGTTYYFVVNSADQSENSAQSTEFSFTTVSGIKGDLNSDGILTPADAAIALRIAASGADDPAADVSGDGSVTSLDALMILQAADGSIGL